MDRLHEAYQKKVKNKKYANVPNYTSKIKIKLIDKELKKIKKRLRSAGCNTNPWDVARSKSSQESQYVSQKVCF